MAESVTRVEARFGAGLPASATIDALLNQLPESVVSGPFSVETTGSKRSVDSTDELVEAVLGRHDPADMLWATTASRQVLTFAFATIPRTESIDAAVTVDLRGPADVELARAVAVTVGSVLDAPLTTVSAHGRGIPNAWRDRVTAMRKAYAAAIAPERSQFGLFAGLPGIAPVTVVRGSIADLLDREALGGVAEPTADGGWVLVADSLDAWTAAGYAPVEASLIEALGPSRFWDPAAGTLPDERPAMPLIASVADRFWDQSKQEWYGPDLDRLADLRGDNAALVNHLIDPVTNPLPESTVAAAPLPESLTTPEILERIWRLERENQNLREQAGRHNS